VGRLRELGWIEGRTIAVEYRWSEGRPERYAEIAAEFVRLNVDVIVTGSIAVPSAKQATSVIPIVFVLALDPVGGGLVASLARPGGNVTGLSIQAADLAGKRLRSRAGDGRGSGRGSHACRMHGGAPGSGVSLRQTKRQLPTRLLHRRSQRTAPSTQVIDPRRPGLRFRGFSRPAVFGALGQVLIIGSDIEHLFLENRIGHILRHHARFLRTVAPVLWII
jgi:hypothetical protein